MPMTFEEWKSTTEGKEACDLSVFPSLPKKHHQYIHNRLALAFECGVASVTQQKEPLVLTPPETNDDKE